MFVFSSSQNPQSNRQRPAMVSNTLGRGFAAMVICAFGVGCATSTPLATSTSVLKQTSNNHVSIDETLPPKAQSLLANVNELLKNLVDGTPESLKQAMSPQADAVNEKVFQVTSKTLKRLGAITSNSIESFQHKNGYYVGQFELQFEDVNAQLSIVTKEDKILAWEFDGEEMNQQLSYTFFDSFKELTIITSSLQDANGNQHEAVFSNGEKVQISLMIAGFERRTNFAHVRLNMHLKNAKGELLRTVNVVDNSLKMKGDEPPAITLSTWLALTEPGNYIVELEIQDVYSDNYLVHAQDIRIKGQAGSSLSKVFLAAQ